MSLYDSIARLYDPWSVSVTEDVEFYVEEAKQAGSPIVELGVGTGRIAVPTAAAQDLANQLVDAGVKIIFNYSEALLQVPPEVTVHTSSPAVDLLYALYFYLT